MTFRELNMRFLEPGSQWVMVIGVFFLCQPWVEVLHTWSVLVMLIGLAVFNVAVHVPHPLERPSAPDANEVPRG